MNTRQNLYRVLIVAGIAIVLFMLYIFIGTYFNLPITTLLPFIKPYNQNTTGSQVPTLPVMHFTMSNKTQVYYIYGKFVTVPKYNSLGVLQAYFVIDSDPQNRQILVSLTSNTGEMRISRSKDNFNGRTAVSKEAIDSIRQSIIVNSPAKLMFYPDPPRNFGPDALTLNIINTLLSGKWDVPDNFVLKPTSIGVIP